MRILVWNIEKFSNLRITAQPGRTIEEADANRLSAQANLQYITTTVAEADADIFVVLETGSSQGGLGTLAAGNGPDGLLTLLAALQQVNPTWRVVPPLRCNPHEPVNGSTYTETVGVFWRNDVLEFTGPWVWPGGDTGPAVPQGDPDAYPDRWNVASGGSRAAAQCIFHNEIGHEVLFPTNSERRPYLTTFRVNDGGRTLKLFSIHTKPAYARDATARILAIDSAVLNPGDNEVTVLAGDFNLNLIGLNLAQNATIRGFRLWDFTLHPIHQPNNSYPPSRYLSRSSAHPNAYLRNELYDYAFEQYGPHAMPDQVFRMLVAERVAGAHIPGNPPDTTPTFTGDMGQTLANINNIQVTFNIGQQGATRDALDDGRMAVLFETTQPHGLVPMNMVLASNLADDTFNGYYEVLNVLDANRLVAVPFAGEFGPANSGGGTITAITRIQNVFRAMPNFGHIGPALNNIGTSDHLPIFLIV